MIISNHSSRQKRVRNLRNGPVILMTEHSVSLFKIQDPSYEFQTTIHPSGKYAYLTVINRNYILRTDYDEVKKEFTTPYTVVGFNSDLSHGGWVDAVGTNARLSRPYQGVFVKNPEYEAEGREDVYDFYFADCTNFCIRYITPRRSCPHIRRSRPLYQRQHLGHRGWRPPSGSTFP